MNNSRVPPNSKDAEESVLGAMMMSKEVVPNAIAQISNPSVFYTDANKLIFSAMKDLHNDLLPIDPITVSDRLEQSGVLEKVGGRYYVTGLLESTPSVSNIDQYIKIVLDKSLLRQTISLGTNMATEGYDASTGAREMVESYRQKIDQFSNGYSEDYNYTEELSKVIEELHGKVNPGLQTGIGSIDHLIGGFQKGNLIIIGGRTSQGKTSLAINIAYNMSVGGQRVLFVSLEMTNTELFKKIISIDTKIPYEKLRIRSLTGDQRKTIRDKDSEFYSLKDNLILLDDLFTLSPIHEAVINHKPDLLIVDFIQN